MSENVSILGNERSFFEDNTFYNNEAHKNNKEISKNSSNAEGTYDKLNNEIKNLQKIKKIQVMLVQILIQKLLKNIQ